MRRFMLLTLLMASTSFGQGRPLKEIESTDPAEIVELKTVFNCLVGDLDFWLNLKQDFKPSEVVKRFDDFTVRVAAIQLAKDTVTNDIVKVLLQVKIDQTLRRRDQLNSTEPGSPRDQESSAQNIIASLNQQLNAVDKAIRDLS